MPWRRRKHIIGLHREAITPAALDRGKTIVGPPESLEFDWVRHAEVWRLSAYSAANCLVAMQLNEMKYYRLRPAELLVFDIVALASVQRTFRKVRKLEETTSDIRPTNASNGSISRRRIADITGLPRATVARILQRLMARNMVHEIARGQLQVPTGIVLQGREPCDLDEMFAPIALLFDQYLRLGIIRPRRGPNEDANMSIIEAIDA